MNKVVKLTESDLTRIVKRIIQEQSFPKQSFTKTKFPFAFDNNTTPFSGEIKDGYLFITTEMGHEFQVGPLEKEQFKGGVYVQIVKDKNGEKVFVTDNKHVKKELKFQPNFTTKKLK
jgi:hypothetical protein